MSSTRPNHTKARIVVIDDNDSNLLLITRVLEFAKYDNIASSQDPRDTLDLVRNDCDLLILDLNMPHMSGIEVIQQLKQELGEKIPPILVLTARDCAETRHLALIEGARDYVTKPFDQTELLARVNNLIEAHLYTKTIRSQNITLEQMVRDRTHELNESRLHIVRTLGRAAEYRDNETGLHTIRMSKICYVLASAAGLDQSECELLLHASPLHDIGKIGIPDNILLKPGALDRDEWEIMKTHTTIGAHILHDHPSPLISMASSIALTHHERWDGGGYPNHLSGEDIPLCGRICAVADVFDALHSERPYKPAWALERALSYVSSEAGRHFDPALVKLFEDNKDRIIKIQKEHPEPMSDTVLNITAHQATSKDGKYLQ